MLNAIYVPEVSFGNTFYWDNGYIEASVASGIGDATLTYVDGSLATRDIYLSKLNSSIGWLDSSMRVIYPLVFKENASIGYLNNFTLILNTSIGLLDSSIKQIYPLVFKINSSIGWLDASVKLLFLENDIQDASISWMLGNHYLKESSIGYGLEFHTGLLDVSINVLDLIDIDVSFLGDGQLLHYDADSSIWRNVDTINIDQFFTTREYIDGSIMQGCDLLTSTQMMWDRAPGHIYGTPTSPIWGPITMSDSSAIIGNVSLAIHSDVSLAIPGTFKRLSGYYDACINNFIYVQYINPQNQLYIIHQIQ
jgi:hypothetical protein